MSEEVTAEILASALTGDLVTVTSEMYVEVELAQQTGIVQEKYLLVAPLTAFKNHDRRDKYYIFPDLSNDVWVYHSKIEPIDVWVYSKYEKVKTLLLEEKEK